LKAVEENHNEAPRVEVDEAGNHLKAVEENHNEAPRVEMPILWMKQAIIFGFGIKLINIILHALLIRVAYYSSVHEAGNHLWIWNCYHYGIFIRNLLK
jgi:hypothetical protein